MQNAGASPAVPSNPEVGPAQKRKRRVELASKKPSSVLPADPAMQRPSPMLGDSRKVEQEDVIVLPDTNAKGPRTSLGFSFADMEAAKAQLSGKRTRQLGPFESLFEPTREVSPDGTVVIQKLPMLPNLSAYWQQDMIFPVMPFHCGPPNTAARDAFMRTDQDIDTVNPVMKPVIFADVPHGKDLMTRWQRLWIDKSGVNPIPRRYANREDDDILQKVPVRVRRPSF
jgi:hypothetical protein